MAPSIGRTLREARTERGLELTDVERATKIRVKFLEAMEDDRWEALPAPAYARGFLDIYARHLGLDREALLDQYRETVEDELPEPIPESVIKPGMLRQHRSPKRTPEINLKPIGKVLAGLVLLVIVGLVIVGSIGGSGDDGGGEKRAKGEDRGTKATAPATPTTTPTTPAGEVSVELRATAPVWVCLVDESGTPLVDSETLNADDARGPFSGGGFEVTFGNGSVEMTVDGEPEQIPQVAEPIGYRITPAGLRALEPSSQPTCL
jgi:cytoskeleton protein RodZ